MFSPLIVWFIPNIRGLCCVGWSILQAWMKLFSKSMKRWLPVYSFSRKYSTGSKPNEDKSVDTELRSHLNLLLFQCEELNGAEVFSKFSGETEANVRSTFAKVRQIASSSSGTATSSIFFLHCYTLVTPDVLWHSLNKYSMVGTVFYDGTNPEM